MVKQQEQLPPLCPTPHRDPFTNKPHLECIGARCAIFRVTGQAHDEVTGKTVPIGACSHLITAHALGVLTQMLPVMHAVLVHLAAKSGVAIKLDPAGNSLLPPIAESLGASAMGAKGGDGAKRDGEHKPAPAPELVHSAEVEHHHS